MAVSTWLYKLPAGMLSGAALDAVAGAVKVHTQRDEGGKTPIFEIIATKC